MTRSEQFIYIERVRRENIEARIKADQSAARLQKQSDRIDIALNLLRAWSAYNLAMMFAHRSES